MNGILIPLLWLHARHDDRKGKSTTSAKRCVYSVARVNHAADQHVTRKGCMLNSFLSLGLGM